MSSAPAILTKSNYAPPLEGTFHVMHIRPEGYVQTGALTELAEAVYFGLRRLGVQVYYREPPNRPARLIVLGAHQLDELSLSVLPPDAIIYNSEQADRDSPWLRGPYLRALKERCVWDYSAENVRRLTADGAQSVSFVPVGYVPELVRIPRLREEIDVLFYGCINPRRQQILEALRARGLRVVTLHNSYGELRDRAIASAKVVLNMHYYEAKIFEIVRVAYLLTNGKAVVAELGEDTNIESDVRDAVYGVPYDRLVEACIELVSDRALRAALEERAWRVFARRREENILAAALGLGMQEPAVAAAAAPGPCGAAVMCPLPPILHLGSGKDYRANCFNVDINPAWDPDAVCDISSPGLIGSTVETTRFGKITLREESFEAAVANDVLEHLGDLPAAMTNTLRLLKAGGTFEILVPYDLESGQRAGSHPSLRAFNERSSLPYTDGHWLDARFDLVSLQLQLSAFGIELQRAGKGMEELLRTPRAVDALQVRLRKRYLQESERLEALRRHPGCQR